MTGPDRDLEAAVTQARTAPADQGIVRLIVRRPAMESREVLDEAELHPDHGLVGDDWLTRGNRRTLDGSSDPAAQLTLVNSRWMEGIAGNPSAWPPAGDQLYVDLDLSDANLPVGTRLQVGTAFLEVSPKPHTGCAKFAARFGTEALRVASTPVGRGLRLRGMYAVVVASGTVRPGAQIRKA